MPTLPQAPTQAPPHRLTWVMSVTLRVDKYEQPGPEGESPPTLQCRRTRPHTCSKGQAGACRHASKGVVVERAQPRWPTPPMDLVPQFYTDSARVVGWGVLALPAEVIKWRRLQLM